LAQRQGAAAAAWRAHWPLVLAAAVGFLFNSLFSFPLGVLMQPMTRDLGWTRSQFTSGLIIPAMIAAPMSPLVGAAIDRWGTRLQARPLSRLGDAAGAGFAAKPCRLRRQGVVPTAADGMFRTERNAVDASTVRRAPSGRTT
jgi:hypothetical protein